MSVLRWLLLSPCLLLLVACPADDAPAQDPDDDDTADDDTADDDAADNDAADDDSGDDDSGDDDSSDVDPDPVVPRVCATWADAVARADVQDGGLSEISGIAISAADPDLLWVHEDSAGPTVLTALGLDGRTRGTITLEGVTNVDWEDIALGPCGAQTCLFVGDFGDNGWSRDEVSILRIEEPAPQADGFAHVVTPEVLPYTYVDGPVDAEALFIDASGLPVVVDKRMDGTARLHRLPELTPGVPVVAEELATIVTTEGEGNLASAVTAADLRRDGVLLLIRTYGKLLEYPVGEGGLAGLGEVQWRELPRGIELQGEAAAWSPDGLSAWHLAETANATMWEVPCAEVVDLE